jgi:sugar lactone lactonase YvrE
VFINPLSSNRHPIVARVGSPGNVFIESPPSSGSEFHSNEMDIDVEYEYVDWSHLAQDKNLWLAFVNMAISLRAPQRAEIS